MDLLPKVFRTEGNIAEFDPSKIYESILKETGMSEEDTRNITELVVRRIISSGIKFLSGPHIREIVCSILSEQHFEDERKLYTRIGMPLMDYEQILERSPRINLHKWVNPERVHHWAANHIAEEYAHLKILNNDESKAHLAGDIHINGLNYFVLRPYKQMWDARLILKNGLPPMKKLEGYYKYKPPKNLNSALHQLNKWLEMIQDEFYGNQGFSFISTFLAPYIYDLTEGEMINEIQSLVYENNLSPLTIGREIPPISILSSISIYEGLKKASAIVPEGQIQNIYGRYNNQSNQIFKALLSVFKEISHKYPNLSFPNHYIFLDHSFLNSIENVYPGFWEEIELICSIYFLHSNSKSYNFKEFKGISEEEFHNYGVLQNVSLNLPRYAYATKDEDKFLDLLRSKLILCSDILLKKYDIIKKRIDSKLLPLCGSPVEGKPIFKLENQGLSVSLVGLNEATKYLTNYDLHKTPETIKFGRKILSKINQSCSELSDQHNKIFIVSENISEKAINRFTYLDSRSFPKEVKLVSNKKLYTNSVHFREGEEINIIDRVKIQEKFHEFIHEGAMIYLSLKDLKKSNLHFKDFFSKIIMESKISNIKFHV